MMIKTTRHQTETETETDQILVDIANYCLADADFPEASLQTATCCLMDAMGCAILALENQACHAHIQPLFPVHMAEKSSITIPGTQYRLDPLLIWSDQKSDQKKHCLYQVVFCL